MSISRVFYALLNDKSATFESAKIQDDHAVFYGHLRKHVRKCPCCQSQDVRIKEIKERSFKMLNLGNKRTYLKLNTYKSLFKIFDRMICVLKFSKNPQKISGIFNNISKIF